MVRGSSPVAVAVALLAIAVFARRLSKDKGASEAAYMEENPVEQVQEATLQAQQESHRGNHEEAHTLGVSAADAVDSTPGQSAATGLDEDIAKLVQKQTQDEWLESLSELVSAHGKEAVEAWKSTKKNKDRLIHLAVSKNYADVVKHMVLEHGFDVNTPRDGDQCTPMHLAMFYKKADIIEALPELGADLTLKNKYGEACDDKYAAFVDSHQNIIWLDLELTHGHYEGVKGGIHSGEAGKILEAAVIVTDKDLKELGRGQWVISGFTKDQLLELKEFHQQHFRDKGPGGEFPPLEGFPGNGLFSDIIASQTTLEAAEAEILKLVKQHCPEQRCPIAGNSIQCDREVLKVHMPDVYAFLSHQILDVSTVLGFMSRWLPKKKAEYTTDQEQHASYDHRALHDAESSIQSMRWARSSLFVQ